MPCSHTAVLLVAGVGRRLPLHAGPKCLVTVGEAAILAHQIHAMLEVGVREFVLVVGHDEHRVRSAVAEWHDVSFSFVHAPDYATSNTLWSLARARDALRAGAWVLNGDVVFDHRLPLSMARAGHAGSVAVQPGLCDAEAVKALTESHSGRVMALSKQVEPTAALGESVGIAHFDATWGNALADALQTRTTEAFRHAYYEVAIEHVAAREPLHAVSVDVPVIEIDNEADLQRARRQVAPLLEGA